MAVRTHEIFRALADEKRLRVLLEVLDKGERRPGDLERGAGLSPYAVSRALRELLREGLVERVSERRPITVPHARTVRALIRAAAMVEFQQTGNPDAQTLAARMQKQDMARGAEEDSGASGSGG